MDFGIASGRAKGGPRRAKARVGKSTERGKGEVNLFPKGIGDVGNGERGLLNHWTPPRGWWDLNLHAYNFFAMMELFTSSCPHLYKPLWK